jgi:eukaryotic-like serine/threonine-protein kinase
MSPEQILGEVVDARSDVFSLGVVLYQMLSGGRPFEKDGDRDRKAAAQRIRRDPPIPLHRRAPDVPRALERIVMRSLEKLPVDRYSSASIVADHLDEFLASRGATNRAALVVQALVRAGLVTGEAGAVARASVLRRKASVRPAVIGLAVLGAVSIAGGVGIQYAGRGGGYRVEAGSRPLELVPAQPGSLRVVATPWAEVWIDGEHVETTPFARPIPLSAGTHYVTLRHPKAAPEKRTINVVSGETLTLDVSMQLEGGEAPRVPDVDAGGKRDAAADAKASKK